MTLATQIAHRIHALDYEDITPEALRWTASAFVDTVGVTLAGISEDGPQILLRVPGIAAAPGPALILGTGRRTSVLDAALVNGVASHALDYDDVAGSMGGHPSAMLVPALIPLAEMLGSSGRDLVTGLCRWLRNRVPHRPRRASPPLRQRLASHRDAGHFRHRRRRRPPAASVGRADRHRAWDGRVVRRRAEGQFRHHDQAAACRPRHPRRRVRRADGAAKASPPIPARSSTSRVFSTCSTAPAPTTPPASWTNWYDPFECGGAGDPGLKPYPCCGSTHPSIGRMIELAHRHDLTPDTRRPHHRACRMPAACRTPTTPTRAPPLAAKFSMQYCVARALADRAVKLCHFEGDAPFDPTVRALMQRLEVRPHPDMPEDWGTEVIVETTDGARFASRLDDYPSRGPAGDPMTHAELWTKFADCAERSLPRSSLSAAFDTLMGIASLADVHELTALLQPEPWCACGLTRRG